MNVELAFAIVTGLITLGVLIGVAGFIVWLFRELRPVVAVALGLVFLGLGLGVLFLWVDMIFYP